MVFVEKDSFRNLRRLPTDAFRSIPRLPREDLVLPVAASDLVAWYPFRSGTGEDITAGDSRFGDRTDYSAAVNGATFKPSGGVTDIQTGANSGAFEFDGTDDTLDLGTVADSDQSLTIMTWLKPDTVTKQFMRILTKADGRNLATAGTLNFLFDSTTGRVRFEVKNNGSNFKTVSPSAVSANVFVHVTGRYDFQNGQITLFINGQPVDNNSPGQLPPFSSQPWRIGEDNPPNVTEFLDGTVDGVRIYTAALSDSQINQIYLNTEP